MAVTYAEISGNYPTDERTDLFNNVLGGGFRDLVGNPNYENTCAMRISIAFNATASKIPQSLGTEDGGHKDRNGNHILVTVKVLETFLKQTLGESNWGMSKQPGTPFNFGDVPRRKGILMYHAAFSNATGHADVWTGEGCTYNCPDPDLNESFAVQLWDLN